MDWAYTGVNRTVARNAGPECAHYLNPTWRIVETVIVLTISVAILIWSCKKIQLPPAVYVRKDSGARMVLLILMCIIWGMEIGYKFSSRTVIYLLNPCHVTTAIQVNKTICIFIHELVIQTLMTCSIHVFSLTSILYVKALTLLLACSKKTVFIEETRMNNCSEISSEENA